MFNVRVKRFHDTEQIQVFQKSYNSKGEVQEKNFNHVTGEIYTKKKLPPSEFTENPFTETNDRFELFGVEPDEEKHRESVRKSKTRTVKMIYDIARSNEWEWFFTFTFSPDKVDRYNYDECSKKFSVWLNNIRKTCPDMVYLVVPEQHKDGAFHFHGLFSNVDELDFHFTDIMDKGGKWIYNCHSYRFGFTTATRIADTKKASSYLCKYITKELCQVTMNRKRYWSSRNAKRPEVTEYQIQETFEHRIERSCEKASHVKMTESAYGNCVYIDRPLPENGFILIDSPY